jgi:hypothetical protein
MVGSLLRGCDSRSGERLFPERLFVCPQDTAERPFAVKGQIDHLFDERVFATTDPVR